MPFNVANRDFVVLAIEANWGYRFLSERQIAFPPLNWGYAVRWPFAAALRRRPDHRLPPVLRDGPSER